MYPRTGCVNAPQGYSPYAMAPAYPMGLAGPGSYDIIGADTPADPNAPQTTWDKIKTFLSTQNSVVPVTNGVLLGVSAGAGLLLYGVHEGWFRRR